MKLNLFDYKNRSHMMLIGIIISSVILHIVCLFLFRETLSLKLSGYDDYAVNILAGRGYTRFPDFHPDSDLPPLYPVFLVVVYSVLGRSPIAVAVMQIGLEVITLIAIYGIANRIAGKQVALLATAFVGFYPYLVFQNLTTNDTCLFIALLAVAVWFIYRASDTGPVRPVILAGLTLGVAALTKSLVILTMPFFGLWWWH